MHNAAAQKIFGCPWNGIVASRADFRTSNATGERYSPLENSPINKFRTTGLEALDIRILGYFSWLLAGSLSFGRRRRRVGHRPRCFRRSSLFFYFTSSSRLDFPSRNLHHVQIIQRRRCECVARSKRIDHFRWRKCWRLDYCAVRSFCHCSSVAPSANEHRPWKKNTSFREPPIFFRFFKIYQLKKWIFPATWSRDSLLTQTWRLSPYFSGSRPCCCILCFSRNR